MTADEVQEALHHQELPFEIAVAGAATRLHAINVVVQRSYSSTLNAEPADGKIGLRPLPSFSAGAQWDLNFFLVWRDEGWRMSCDADIELYDEATVKALTGRFGNDGFIQLTGAIGYYSMLAMTVNACELEAAPGAEVLKV